MLHEIETYLRKTDMAETRFGRETVNDPAFVRDLRTGRVARERTLRRVREFMERNPDGLAR